MDFFRPNCLVCEKKSGTLYHCSSCQQSIYCSATCQKLDWNRHYQFCNQIIPYSPGSVRYFNYRVKNQNGIVYVLTDSTTPKQINREENQVKFFDEQVALLEFVKYSAFKHQYLCRVNITKDNAFTVLDCIDFFNDARFDSFADQKNTVNYGTVDLPNKSTKFKMLQAYMSSRPDDRDMETLTKKLLDAFYFASKTTVPTEPITLYRGLSFDTLGKLKLFLETCNANNIIGRSNVASSWSSNILIAGYFAHTDKYGLILEHVAAPEEVLVDTRFFTRNVLLALYPHGLQREVLLKPNINFPCRIIYQQMERKPVGPEFVNLREL